MINLLKFKEKAVYEDGRETDLTGREAYAIYKDAFQALVKDSGAAMVWHAPMECVVTGPQGEWDEAFVMGYPNSGVFMAMVKNEEYIRDVVPHRSAAVADSRLIRFAG
mgnify:CR=1 FL=1